ncbi:hypothetical protein [Sorangium sp. So ce1099]|uniref:hypothetical protein n=1 Tax=Sorangium sp. So ce1099 TaxID=3133331 RepID=UPI003F646829
MDLHRSLSIDFSHALTASLGVAPVEVVVGEPARAQAAELVLTLDVINATGRELLIEDPGGAVFTFWVMQGSVELWREHVPAGAPVRIGPGERRRREHVWRVADVRALAPGVYTAYGSLALLTFAAASLRVLRAPR